MNTPQTTRSPLKIQFFVFFEPYNDKIAWFSESHELLVLQTWLTPQSDHKNVLTMDVLRCLYPSETGSAPKMPFFWALYDEISKVSTS